MNKGWVFLLLLCVVGLLEFVSTTSKKNTTTFVVYGNMKCPFTVKMLNELESKGHTFRFVDVSTKDGHHIFSKVTTETNGVPYTVNTTTGEHIIGYRPM